MNETNSNELEAQLRTLAQAHQPDAAFAEQLEQRLMSAHVVAKPSLWSRVSGVLKGLRLAEVPSENDLPEMAAHTARPRTKWSLASAVLLAGLVLASGLVFAAGQFRPVQLGGPLPLPTGLTNPAKPTMTKPANTKPTVAPRPTASQTKQSSKYIVVAGDTCSAIAARFQIRLSDLISFNSLSEQCIIQIGQQLTIPNVDPYQIVPIAPLSTASPAAPIDQRKPSLIKLNYFHLSATEAAVGERITATWSFEGAANKVAILVPQPGETGEYLYSSSPITQQIGAMMFSIPRFFSQTQDVQLSVNDTVIASVQLNKALPKCKDPWFFSPRPEGCPDGPIIQTFAAVQQFEGGRMFWFQHNKTIVVLYNDAYGTSTTVQTFADNYVDGTPEADPGLIAPAGKQQPKRGFGWVWRTYANVHERLGWAVQPEQGFNTCIAMTNAQTATPNTYFADNEGHLINLMGSGLSGYYGWYSPTLQEGVPVNVQCNP